MIEITMLDGDVGAYIQKVLPISNLQVMCMLMTISLHQLTGRLFKDTLNLPLIFIHRFSLSVASVGQLLFITKMYIKVIAMITMLLQYSFHKMTYFVLT